MVQRWFTCRAETGNAGGIHRTVIKPGPALSTITDAMYNEPLTFDVVPGNTADTRIFRLHGPITLSNLFDFQKVLTGGTEKLTILDFTESEYIDSAGLGVILNYYVSGKRHGRTSGWLRSTTGLPSC